jgi:hypothetical protein
MSRHKPVDMQRDLIPAEDKEGDIADDPLVYAVHLELQSINKRSDNRLLIALAISGALVWLVAQWKMKNVWIDVLEIAVIMAIVLGTIYSAIRQKQIMAVRHGLVCSHCGNRPWVAAILSAATTRHCAKCGAPLNVT